MLHCHAAGVEEDQEDDNPIEHLLLHNISDDIPENLVQGSHKIDTN